MKKLEKLMARYLPWRELPQNILGRISSRAWKKWLDQIDDSTLRIVVELERCLGVKIYVVTQESWRRHRVLSNINSHSLGKYICVVFSRDPEYFERLVRHECGHAGQSKDLGWLYLPVVGLPSAARCYWSRVMHRRWTQKQKDAWYFGGWPEDDADKRGGVARA